MACISDGGTRPTTRGATRLRSTAALANMVAGELDRETRPVEVAAALIAELEIREHGTSSSGSQPH